MCSCKTLAVCFIWGHNTKWSLIFQKIAFLELKKNPEQGLLYKFPLFVFIPRQWRLLILFNLPRLIVIPLLRKICNISKTRKSSVQHIDCDFSLYPPFANKPVKNTFIVNKKVIYSVVRDIYFVFLLYWQPLLTSSLALNFLWRICDISISKWWFCSYLTSHQCPTHQFLQSELWQASLWFWI